MREIVEGKGVGREKIRKFWVGKRRPKRKIKL